MIELQKGLIYVDKSSTERTCIKCAEEITKERYHLILDDKKKKIFLNNPNTRKVRIHFDCFEKLTKDLVETQNKLDEIKAELMAKRI